MRRAFSVAIFARHAGRILLIHHTRLGTWLPVGGELEDGETPLEAAVRELREETGLVGELRALGGVDGTPVGLMSYEEHQAGSKGLHMNFCFLADVPSATVVQNHEFTQHRWVDGTTDLECPPNVRQLVDIALASGRSPLENVARRWLDAFNARDLERLLGLYADDAIHRSPKLLLRQPETRGEVRGKSALRAWWQDAMTRLPGLRYDLASLTADERRVFMEYVRRVPGEPDMLVAEVLECAAGRIVASRVFHG